MKKYIIALAVLGMFVLYSLGIRNKLPVLSKPSSLATNTAPSSSSTSSAATTNSGGTTLASSSATGKYKDGAYTGSIADAYYGNVQVSTIVSGGKITDVKFLHYPDTHSTSVSINQQVMPYLKQEAIQSQSSNVQIISGATFTSQAFVQSLASALSQAKA